MEEIKMKAYGKINLSLDVVGKRENGYHDVEMIMQSVSIHDDILIRKQKSGITLLSDNKEIPVDERNIAYKAAALMKRHFNIEQGVEITINKRIPVAAGMAGGSADAAAVLKGMNELYSLNGTKEVLADLGLSLGADVPFCLMGGTVLARGIGEELTPLAPLVNCNILISKPTASVSTKWVYETYDEKGTTKHPDTKALLSYINKEDLHALAKGMYNVLEAVTAKEHVQITTLKEVMTENGAIGSLMTGSGPTVFGLFETEEEAKKALSEITKRYPGNQNFIVRPI